MKTVIQKVLTLWSFEVAKRNGSHFEKTALKDLMCHFARRGESFLSFLSFSNIFY